MGGEQASMGGQGSDGVDKGLMGGVPLFPLHVMLGNPESLG